MASTREQSSSHQHHLNALLSRHNLLEQKIETEQKSRSVKEELVRKMKAEKLRLKDEIEQRKRQE